MKPVYKQIIKFFAFLVVAVILFWLVYRDQNPADLIAVLREDVDYTWVWIAIALGLLSHVSRAMRWQLVARSMGYRISFMNSFMGVMIGYFANLALPRMGEFTRCGVVSKYEHIPFSKLLGTVVTERVFDVMMLLALTLIVMVTQFKQVGVFLDRNEEIKENLYRLAASPTTWILAGALVVLLFVVVWYLRRGTFFARLHQFLSGVKEGLLSVRHVKRKSVFVAHTVFIWLMYFLMLYICFFCFDFTSGLGPMVGLTVFVISSYGMVAPVQGGVGAYHFMVIAALAIYLPQTPEIESLSKAFALLTHGTMTLLYIVMGCLCLLFLPIYNRKKH